MSISDKVKAMLALSGKKQVDLADYFEMTKQSMNNKMARDSWPAKDLAKAAAFCGGRVLIELPDGQKIYVDVDE